MAKKVKKAVKKTAKKVIKKVLDSTELDEKIVANINENRSLYNKILCYTKCYGGYILALVSGCTFKANIWVGLGLLLGASAWAYWITHCSNKNCRK